MHYTYSTVDEYQNHNKTVKTIEFVLYDSVCLLCKKAAYISKENLLVFPP